jgi:chemotaxis protein methyltransferase CheR
MDKIVNLTDIELEKLALFLQKKIGIWLESAKLQRFKRKIEDIFTKRGIENFNEFYHRLRFVGDESLIQDLINAVTVNETYFWREYEQFLTLVDEVLPLYLNKNETPLVRILVSPCSSGEELYSIMLCILENENLLKHLNIEMVGIDIDSTMIDKAKKALYTKRSIEKLPKKILDKYFTKVGNFYQLEYSLRKNARFLQANIFDLKLQQKLGNFDIIFSRNMLIYFNKEDKRRCFKIFHKLLKENSYLFLGHADANEIDKTLFSPIKSGFHLFRANKI